MDDKGLTDAINKFFNKHASFDAAHRKFFARDMALDQAALDWAIDGFFHGDNDNDEAAVDAAIHKFFGLDAEGKDPVKEGWVGRSGESGEFTAKGTGVGAGPADIPAPPQIKSTQAANLGKQKHLNALHKYARAGEWDKVEAYPTPGVNTYAKMVQKYKASLLALKGKAPAATAPTKPAPKKEKLSEVGLSIPQAMNMYDDMLQNDFTGIKWAESLTYEELYHDDETGATISIHKPEHPGGNLQWEVGEVAGSSIADLKQQLTKLKAEKAKPTPTAPNKVPQWHKNELGKLGLTQIGENKESGQLLFADKDSDVQVLLVPQTTAEGNTTAKWSVFIGKAMDKVDEGINSTAMVNAVVNAQAKAQAKPATEPTPVAAPTLTAVPTPTGAKEPGKIVTPIYHDTVTQKGFTVGHVSKLTGGTEYTAPDGGVVTLKPPAAGSTLLQWEYTNPDGETEDGKGTVSLSLALNKDYPYTEPTKSTAPAKPAGPAKPAEPAKPPTEPPKPAEPVKPDLPEGFEPATSPGTIVKPSYSEPMAEHGFKVKAVKPDDGSTLYEHPKGYSVLLSPPDPGHTSAYWMYVGPTGTKKGKGSSELQSALGALPAKTYIGAGSKKPPPLQSEYGKAKYEDAFGNVLEAVREADTTKIPGNFYAEAVTALGDDPHNADTTAVTSVMQKLHQHYKQDMTSGQISAITDYQGSGSGAINSYLRGATSESSVSPSTKTKVNAIRKAMENSYIPVRMYMARGMHNSIAEITGFSDPDEAVGRVFVHRNFASFSRSESTAKSFAGMTGTVLHCVFPPGCRGVVVDKQSWEDETIFPDHTVFRVDKITKGDAGDKRSHIYCSWLGVTTMEQTSKGVSEV